MNGSRRPSIGIYCPGVGTGGPWRYVHSILAGIDSAEFEVGVFCDLPGRYDPQPWVKVIRLNESAPTASGPVPPFGEATPVRRSVFGQVAPKAVRLWAGFGREARRLSRLIRRHHTDLFHTQNTGCEESPVAAKLAGVRRVVGTFHVDSTVDLHGERSGVDYRLLEVASNRCLDTAIAVSAATKQDWVRRSGIPANRVVTIHNGIDPDRFRRQSSREAARRELHLPVDALVVGGLGRLDEAKGFTYLIDAVARLRSEFPKLLLAIAGAGPLRESLERQAAERGVSQWVRFLGFQTDVQTVLDSLDVFAMPSLCETLGYALLEAMATELPAVGAAVGGVPEVILDGQTGLLTPPRSADELAGRLRVLLGDEGLRAGMGAAARERVCRHFHERDMVRRTLDVYRKALPCRPSRAT